MQERLKEAAHSTLVQKSKSVILNIRSRSIVLSGQWEWDLAADVVYCSDVMSFPPQFEGTKGIFHPDDLTEVTKALELMQEEAVPCLSFRLITTFGEVKKLTGREVSIAAVPVALESEAVKQNLETRLQEIGTRKEAATLRMHQQLRDISDRLYGTGTWYTNKTTGDTWYSDNVYRLHGVPPQSLNAHANTFHLFIHPEDRVAVTEAIENAYAAEVPLHIEYRIVQPSGAVRRVRQVTHWMFDERGQLIFSGSMCDITEVQGLQQNLELSETVNRQLQQIGLFTERQASSGYWYMNMVTRKVTFSDNYLRIHGIKAPFIPSHQTFLKLVHPDDRQRIAELMEQVHREHILPETEYRIVRQDGRERQLRLSGKLLVQPGSELMMMGALHDITAQKTLELNVKALTDAQALQNLTTDLTEQAAEVCSAVWFSSGRMQWSDGLFRLLGYKPGSVEPVMRLWQKGLHPEDVKPFNDTINMVLNGQAVSEQNFRIISRWGIRYLRLTFRQLTQVAAEGVLGVIQDITTLVTLQDGAKSKEQYTSLLENRSRDLVLLTNTENVILNWNKTAEEKTGIKKDDALFANLFDILPALHEEKYLSQLQAALNGREVNIEKTQKGYLSKTHSYSMVPFRDEQGAVQSVLHLVQDISKELDLQQQLSERLHFIENLLDATVDRIVVLDHQMNYLYWNPKAEEYYGLNKHRVLGKNILEVFPAFHNHPSYQEFRRALKGETVHLPASAAEGSSEYSETYILPVRNEEGTVNAVLWIVHDLSKELLLQQERKQNLALLQEEHRRMADAQAIGHIGSFEWNAGSETVSWSDELYRIIGWEPQAQEIMVEMTDAMVHPDDREAFLQLKQQSIEQPGVYHAEHRIVRPDGQTIYVAQRFESTAGKDGTLVRVHGTVQNITEQVAARHQLVASNALLRQTEDVGRIGSYELILADMEIRFSAGMYRLFGEEPGSFKPTSEWIDNRSHPEDVLVVRDMLQKAIVDKQPYYYTRRIYHKDGQWRIVESHGKVICDVSGRAVKLLGLVQDITERKKTEENLQLAYNNLQTTKLKLEGTTAELQKNIALLQQSEELAQIGSWEYDIALGKFNWSDTMYALFDKAPGEPVRPEIYLEYATEACRPNARRVVRFLKKEHTPFEDTLHVLVGGTEKILRIKASVIKDDKGRPEKMIGVDMDITNIREAEAKLKESQNILQQTVLATPDAIVVLDMEGKSITYLNNKLAEWSGYSNEALLEMGFEGRLALAHPDDRLKLALFNDELLSATDEEVKVLDYRLQGTGRQYWLRNRSRVFRRSKEGTPTHYLSILQDITEAYAVQEELISLNDSLQQKNAELEAKNEEITSFAFVASHDLKEPIRKIHTFTDMLLHKSSEELSESSRNLLTRMDTSVTRLSHLIRDIQELFSIHSETAGFEDTNLNEAVRKAMKELTREIEETGAIIEVGSLPRLRAISPQIIYLFKNLISNAIKFQPAGNTPRVTITAENVPAASVREQEAAGHYLKITVQDNGIGFDKEYKDKVFRIFQRLHTREEFAGTGMGLTICQKVMKNHAGFIQVDSKAGQGTAFCCFFPL